jgi:hypothetical protein
MSNKYYLILTGSSLLLLGQIFAWFLNNSQFVWEWWKDKPLLTAAIWSFPVSLAFWWGSKLSYEGLGTAWASRLLGFGLSYFSFPILTWMLLGESAFTPKNIVSSLLAFTLVGIQIFWKG